jgi:hypothetical protein
MLVKCKFKKQWSRLELTSFFTILALRKIDVRLWDSDSDYVYKILLCVCVSAQSPRNFQVIQHLIMQFSPLSYFTIPFGKKMFLPVPSFVKQLLEKLFGFKSLSVIANIWLLLTRWVSWNKTLDLRQTTKKQTQYLHSASKLYRLCDHLWSANLVLNFASRRMSRS